MPLPENVAQLGKKVHAEQLRHVRNGCLARTRHNISSDGSRIEGSHKGWNAIQQSFASGLEVFCALGHDFVLRRNIRIISNHAHAAPFVASTFGSHHIHLVNHTAAMWNTLLKKEEESSKCSPLPELQDISSNEEFGLVQSKHIETFGGLLEIKDEEDEGNILDLSMQDDMDVDGVLQRLDVDPALRFLPQQPANRDDISSSSDLGGDACEAILEPAPITIVS